MQQQTGAMQQNLKHYHALEDSKIGYKSTAREMLQQPWPFGMSRARPPGRSPPVRATALALRHCQQEQIIPSESEQILLKKSLRADGWLSLGKDNGKIEFMDSVKDSSLSDFVNQLEVKGGKIIRDGKSARPEKQGKGIKEHITLVRGGDEKDEFNQDLSFDTKKEQVHTFSQLHSPDEEKRSSKSLGSTNKPNWAVLSMEDVFHDLDKTTELPSLFDFLCIVQKCRKEKNPMFVFKLHLHICKSGLGTDAVVGNHLVPMFVECGSVLAAQQAFIKLAYQNEHSWSFLVLGFSTNGQLKDAVDLYQDMKRKNVQPTSFTFVGLVKACSLLGNLEVGRFVHAEINQKGFTGDAPVGNSLIDMYIKCGSLAEAEEVFQNWPVQDVVSWTTLISGYVEHELGQEALSLYCKMQSKGISANAVTISLAVRACRSIEAINEGRKIHSEAVEKGYDSDISVSSGVLSLYTKCDCHHDALNVFSKLQVRDVISWNSLIVAYAEHGPYQKAIECSEQMQAEEVAPDVVTFSCVLKACASLGAVEQGQEIHIRGAKSGLVEDISVGNSLIGMYGRCGLLLDARKVFDELQVRDVVSWTALIAGYAEHSSGEEALICFKQMQESGLVPNDVTYFCALKACGLIGFVDEGRELHRQIVGKGFDLELRVANTLVSMYATCGSLIEALNIFEKIPVRSVVSWTALIGRYTDCGSGVEALKCFNQMQSEEILPNAITFSCILKACGSIGAVDKGRELHAQIAGDGFELDSSSVVSALINMYARCGSLSEAREVFNDIPVCDVSAWSAMIKAYAMNHEGRMAVNCFEDMQQQGIKPDIVTFTCLLSACSHAGLRLEGQGLFKLMREKYDLAPTIEHYSCMVDLLARAGDLYEAEKLLETFAPPAEDTWAALLSACKSHGQVELGLRCFQQLVQRDPEDAAWYVLMADIYTAAGRWQDGNIIERFRKHVEAKKKRASAWIEVNEEVHEFMVGDDQSDDVVAAVRELNLRLKDEGHVPNSNVVVRPITDYQKESALCEHAEKLAIAFGLLNTPQGSTLRVSKNLRMCPDCHNAGKIISKIERREIILRDDCCMHHFKDGSCACGDMF